MAISVIFFFFFFNDTATTEIYTLSLHDALPISGAERIASGVDTNDESRRAHPLSNQASRLHIKIRSEEHTSELQSQSNLVCRLLLEKKKKKKNTPRDDSIELIKDLHHHHYPRPT